MMMTASSAAQARSEAHSGASTEAPAKAGGVTLVLGGARSGKSRHAEGLLIAHPGPWTYIATAQAFDGEMRERIDRHRADRGSGWVTVEAPLDLPAALRAVRGPVLVDCLTLWLSNLMMATPDGGPALEAALDALLAVVASPRPGPVVLVSNEVGWGIVPDNALARAFRDHAGRLHQRLAVLADQVVLVVAGLPLVLKAPGPVAASSPQPSPQPSPKP